MASLSADKLVRQTLVIAFTVIVRDEVLYGCPQRFLAEEELWVSKIQNLSKWRRPPGYRDGNGVMANDHVIVFNERSLHRHLQAFVDYYHRHRVHLALEKDTPELRLIQPPECGRIVSIPVLGGLHHRYERRAA
jgi:hypothetical protein